MITLYDSGPVGPIRQPWLEQYPKQVPYHLDLPPQPLGWLLEKAAADFPDRIACHYYEQQLTYSDLLSQARRLASLLIREGLQPGDRVGLLLPNLPEYLVTIFGTWMAGGVVVALSPLMVQEAVTSLIQLTSCRFVITLDVLAPLAQGAGKFPAQMLLTTLSHRLTRLERLGYAWVRFRKIGLHPHFDGTPTRDFDQAISETADSLPDVPIDIHGPAYVLPTGGTTGSPKAVVLSHRNLLANAWQLSRWSMCERGTETMLGVLPFFHSYGLSACVLNGVAMGATLVLHHRFRPQSVIRLIERHRPTMFLAVPAMLAALNSTIRHGRKHDLSSLKVCISGGFALSPRVADEFSSRTGCAVVEGYGLSEASPVTHVGPLDGSAIPGTIGLPLPDTEACIVDPEDPRKLLPAGKVGELLIRGPQVMLGYWQNPSETERVLRNGWLQTGDLATCDEKGFFKIVDRLKDLIITSGFNVYPTDVEAVLRTFPGVRDVAVVGQPDEAVGEIVKAVVVVEPGRKRFNRHDFEAFAREKLSAHQRPKIVETRTEDLPRNFLGKVLRRELREELDPEPLQAAAVHIAS